MERVYFVPKEAVKKTQIKTIMLGNLSSITCSAKVTATVGQYKGRELTAVRWRGGDEEFTDEVRISHQYHQSHFC